MPHLGSSFTSYADFLNGADQIYSTRLNALNSSGVTGTVIFAVQTNDDGTGYVNVAVTAENLAPNQTNVQHVHGTFDADGNPTDAVTPTIADDADGDGIVEVLEGLPRYGDILMPVQRPDGTAPTSDANGDLAFVQTFQIENMANFISPVTGTQYSFQDVMDVALREYVIHGVVLPDGIGAGTGGEADGGVNGFTPILPAAAGEFEQIDLTEAMRLLTIQRADASSTTALTGGNDTFDAGPGDDTVIAGNGNDVISGGGDNDLLFGQGGADTLSGGDGDDTLVGGTGADTLNGDGGDDVIKGGNSTDVISGGTGADLLLGQGGDDNISGGDGDDVVNGGAGADLILGDAGNDYLNGAGGADSISGGADDDVLLGGSGDDILNGDAGNDVLAGGADDDSLFGGDGDDVLSGGGGDDLLVGGDGADVLRGGAGLDIIGGLGGNDIIFGGGGADEFHFNGGTGSDTIRDYVQGEDVISFLDTETSSIQFANSTTDAVRGDSDLNAADFDTVLSLVGLDAGNDQQVVFSFGGTAELETGTAAAVEAYIAANDGVSTAIYYDDDWSTLAGRELVVTLENFASAMTVSDYDVY